MALVVTACSGDDGKDPSSSGTASSGSSGSSSSTTSQAPAIVPVDGFQRLNVLPAPVAQQDVLDSSQGEPRTARAEVLQVSKVGSAVRVVVAWDRPVEGDAASGDRMRSLRHPLEFQYEIGLRLYDPAGGTLAEPLRAEDGTCLCSQNTGRSTLSDRQSLYWADFPAPTGTTATLLMGQATPPMQDLPITDDAPALTLPEDLVEWVENAPPAEVGAGAAAPVVRQVRRTVQTFGGAEDAQVGQNADVSVPSDVLFAFDSSTLTSAAKRILSKAAPQLVKAARGKAVQVVGHTDDQGSNSYNQKLSERRASAVARALKPALSRAGITVKASGKGETQPIVPNRAKDGDAIPENQQRNRRVSFVFPRARGGDAVAIDVPKPLPKMAVAKKTTASPKVTGSLASVLSANGKARLDVTRAQRVGEDLWVRFDFTSVGSKAPWGANSGLLDENPVASNATMTPLRLVDAQQKRVSPPLDAGSGICLCTEDMGSGALYPDPMSLWAVFPAPAASTTKVTLRVPGVGQVVDVPLS
ncbi:hypothetical protein GCM10027446_08180 [Angustibacter peucedani]